MAAFIHRMVRHIPSRRGLHVIAAAPDAGWRGPVRGSFELLRRGIAAYFPHIAHLPPKSLHLAWNDIARHCGEYRPNA
ncbi:hypothetical protein [Burkholderia sp. WSM2230]|uniref:hypothetical protein n=1 Tax=Burkholderia sp. WSM2230 TaxID=944435 RepID=UPI0012EBA93B|nr:hypothetical protein [Burkholderia sp. WSM2230]